MKKLALLAMLGMLAMSVPALAYKLPHPPKPPRRHKPPKPAKPPKPPKPPKQHKPHRPHKPKPSTPPGCGARNVGYHASGALVTDGTGLSADGHRRYSGAIEVILTKANHHSPIGDHTFTLVNVKIRFHEHIPPSRLSDGDRVNLRGDITKLTGKCSTARSTPTITIKKIDIKRPRKATHHHPHR